MVNRPRGDDEAQLDEPGNDPGQVGAEVVRFGQDDIFICMSTNLRNITLAVI